MGQSLLDGSDASGVAAFDDIFDLFGKYQFFLLYDLTVFDDVDGDVVVDECQDIQIQRYRYHILPSECLFCPFFRCVRF